MSRDTIVTLYHYDELSDRAKEKARDWYRRAFADDTFWSEHLTDDMRAVAKACGLELSGRNPNNKSDKGLYWSGFSSQGDGASFSGSWRASYVDVAAILEGNEELAPILNGFAALKLNYPDASGSIEQRGHYYHEHTMRYETDIGDEPDANNGMRDELESDFAELCRDLARWFYRSLEREYEYQNSDETIAENIVSNEYELTEDGGSPR